MCGYPHIVTVKNSYCLPFWQIKSTGGQYSYLIKGQLIGCTYIPSPEFLYLAIFTPVVCGNECGRTVVQEVSYGD